MPDYMSQWQRMLDDLGGGYKPLTTFWQDFSIADQFSEAAVKDTFDRAFTEWKDDYKYLTELVMVLNHKLWQHYEIPYHRRLAELYENLWSKSSDYAVNHLKGAELDYYFSVTD